MNKKILITIGILVIAIALLGVNVIHIHKSAPSEEQLGERFSEFRAQYQEKKAQGYDVAEAEELMRKARQAFDKKDYVGANKLLEKAFEALKNAKIPVVPTPPSSTPSVWIREGPIYETHPYYYDGTFKGLIEKIPEIADLGIKTVYLMPVWEQAEVPTNEEKKHSSHIYNIKDYKIDPVYGTPQELKELVDTAHEYNIKVILDLVPSHTWKGSVIWNNNWIHRISLLELQKKAKELGWTLEYKTIDGDRYVYSNCIKKDRLLCDLFGMITVGNEVILSHYPSAGWGFAVDYTDPGTIEYFTKVAEYYVREYDIDGWRIDAPSNNWNPDIISGDHSIQQLLRSVKRAITEVRPDAILLTEGPSIAKKTKPTDLPEPVLDEMCEASYSYYFHHKLGDIIKEKNPQQLIDILADEKIWYNRTRTRFLETHDTKRINEIAPQLNKPSLVLISTIPGVPMIQAGQEIGANNAFWSNPPVNWAHGDYEFREFYKKVFEIRNNNNALKYGTIENVWKSGNDTYAYLREYQDEKAIVVINFLDKEATSYLDLSFLDKGTVLYDELNDTNFVVNNPGSFRISVPAYGSRILVLK